MADAKDTHENDNSNLKLSIEILLKGIGLLSIYLILISAVKLNYYYHNFQINIADYIEPSEFIVLIETDIFHYFWRVFGVFLFILIITFSFQAILQYLKKVNYPRFVILPIQSILLIGGALLSSWLISYVGEHISKDKIHRLKVRQMYVDVKVRLIDGVVYDTTNYSYIGKTNKFIFLSERTRKDSLKEDCPSLAIPMNQVKSFKLYK